MSFEICTTKCTLHPIKTLIYQTENQHEQSIYTLQRTNELRSHSVRFPYSPTLESRRHYANKVN